MVKFVAGDRLDVIALMGPGVDPHLYKPSAGDAATLAKADLIFFSGSDAGRSYGRRFCKSLSPGNQSLCGNRERVRKITSRT